MVSTQLELALDNQCVTCVAQNAMTGPALDRYAASTAEDPTNLQISHFLLDPAVTTGNLFNLPELNVDTYAKQGTEIS